MHRLSKLEESNPEDQELINFLTHSIFCGKVNVANLVVEYRETPSIITLIIDIVGKKSNDSTKEFLEYLKKITSIFPAISKLDFTNPHELRKAFLLIDSGDIKFQDKFNDIGIKSITAISLSILAKHCPLNAE